MTLLPSPAAVRCQLALDIPVQIRGMLDLGELPRTIDEEQLTSAAFQHCEAVVIDRLQEVIPIEELNAVAESDDASLEELWARLPFTRVITLMTTATALADFVAALRNQSP